MKIAVIEGDDASPEAMKPSVEILSALVPEIEWVYPLVGTQAIEKYGSACPDESKAIIDDAKATYFGSTSGPSSAALFYLRWGKETYANVRPAIYYPGARTPLSNPEDIDLVIVRENLEDLYMGVEGELDELRAINFHRSYADKPLADLGEGRFAIKAITREGTERVVRYSFELARQRAEKLGRPGRLTCTAKYNIMPQSDGFFRKVAMEIAPEYSDVEFEVCLADAFLCNMIMDPHKYDVVVMPNLYGDLFSDGAAGLVGGLGLAPSGCYGNDYAYFESAHGTAPDIAGQNIINPSATILSGAMMLDYLGYSNEAIRLEAAVKHVYAEGNSLTPDQGGSATTTEFCDTVMKILEIS